MRKDKLPELSFKVMRNLLPVFFFWIGLMSVNGQALSEKEKELNDTKNSKLFFAEDKKCRSLIRSNNYEKAEVSCRQAVSLAEKLPLWRALEKHGAYEALGITLLYQRKAKEAIVLFNKSLEVARTKLNETDSETGEIYFFIGQAHHYLEEVELAHQFYMKAENAYRAAFKKIDEDEIRGHYPMQIRSILRLDLRLLEDAGKIEESAKVKQRLEEFEKEFAKYLAPSQ